MPSTTGIAIGVLCTVGYCVALVSILVDMPYHYYDDYKISRMYQRLFWIGVATAAAVVVAFCCIAQYYGKPNKRQHFCVLFFSPDETADTENEDKDSEREESASLQSEEDPSDP